MRARLKIRTVASLAFSVPPGHAQREPQGYPVMHYAGLTTAPRAISKESWTCVARQFFAYKSKTPQGCIFTLLCLRHVCLTCSRCDPYFKKIKNLLFENRPSPGRGCCAATLRVWRSGRPGALVIVLIIDRL